MRQPDKTGGHNQTVLFTSHHTVFICILHSFVVWLHTQ